MDGFITKNCTFDITSQNRCLSIAEFYCKFGMISNHSYDCLQQQIVTVLEAKYQLNNSEANVILELVQKAIKQDFDHLETDFNTISYVILGHDLENIKMGHFNEYNWLYKAILAFME